MSGDPIIALAWALVHFIWQGAAIALAAGAAGAVLRRARPTTRYAVFCGALGAMLLAPAVTYAVMRKAPAAGALGAVAAAIESLSAAVPGPPTVPSGAGPLWFEWLVAIWLSGVAVLGLRACGGWVLAQRLRRFGTAPVAEAVQRACCRLRERLGLRRAVRVMGTTAAEVPATLGWLRPVVLLPVSAFTVLTPEQIELLIAHELAHVRRHDYLVNLAQTAVETVLFYHPAVWWVSARIRREREHCCDDLAVGACGNVALYVRALATLAGLRTRQPSFVVAATGGSLLFRIQRLMSQGYRQREAPPGWLGALVPAALVLAAVFSATPPEAVAESSPKPEGQAVGFLGELAESGYPKLEVDDIIALKDHGVDPPYVRDMLSAGLGVPSVSELIRVRDHGIAPGFVASVAASHLVSDLDFETVIRLRENDVRGDDLSRIRALGFGPFSTDEIVKLRQHGVDAATFSALKEAGADRAGVADAIAFRENDVTAARIRDMKRQGFDNLSVGQILKLRRAGII